MTRWFGFSHCDLETARHAVETTFGIQLEHRESLYWGGDYYQSTGPDGLSMSLRYNRDLLWKDGDDPEERFAKPAFAAYPVFLKVCLPDEQGTWPTVIDTALPGAVELSQIAHPSAPPARGGHVV